MKKKRFLILYLLWIVVIVSTYFLSLFFTINFNNQIIKASSRAFFREIVNTRSWNSIHGGVYMVVSDTVQPNPYLEDSLRDLITTEGILLTKINPAYMTRQISEVPRSANNATYHITSLKPIRPANLADEWEREKLESFEQGVPEAFELVETAGGKVFRYMAPLLVENSCMKCHAKQGYLPGQIRGGISVTTPGTDFFHAVNQQILTRSILFAFVLLIGLTGIFFFRRTINKQFQTVDTQNKNLALINLEKDRLLSIVAHDLRSPISGIHGLSQILLTESETLTPEEQIRIISSISNSSENILRLSEHLIQWYQTRKGILETKPELFLLEAIIEEVTDLYTENAEKKGITFVTTVPSGMKVYADINMVETIIRNLLSNALKFTATGGMVRITAKDIPASDFIEISVKDNGTGMDQLTCERLFKEDFNPSTPGTENEVGTGLGLAICREFVKKNLGSIHVISTLNVGTEFILTLPKRKLAGG